MKKYYVIVFSFFPLLLFQIERAHAQAACNTCSTVTTYTANLTSSPNNTYTVTSARSGQCCQGSGSDRCVRFNVSVHPQATEIQFTVSTGNNGTWEIDCAAPIYTPTSKPCLNGLTNFCITYCNPGAASDTYTITTSGGLTAGADVNVRSGCAAKLSVNGLNQSTITWNSITGGSGLYNNLLSCVPSCASASCPSNPNGCDSAIVTPNGSSPSFIDYTVCGTKSGCSSGTICDTIRVNVSPTLSVTPTATSTVICTGDPNVTIYAGAAGGNPPYTYLWSPGGSTTSAVTVGAGTYTVSVRDNTGCSAVTNTITIASATTPSSPAASATPNPICAGSSLSLSASSTGTTYNWAGPNSFTSSLQNPTPFAVIAASAGTYSVTATTSGCTSTAGTVSVTVNPIPAAPTASGATICEGTSATLTATAPGGTYQWYDAPSGGTLLQTGATYTTPALTVTTTYYVQTTISGCVGPRTAVTVTVNPTPAAPTVAGATICEGTSATLTATAPGGTYEWYNAASGGTLLQTGATYTTPVLSSNTTYYVQATISGCVGPRTAVTVTVNPTPAAPTATGAAICEGTSATLTATAPGGNYEWYDAASGGTLLQTGASYTSPVLASTTTYYVQTTIAGCVGPRTAVTVTVNPTPAAPTASGPTICEGTSATLTATAPGGTYEWYDAPAAGTLLQTGASYTTITLTTTTTYYVQTTISGCAGPRTAVTVTVTPLPAAPTTADVTICVGTSATLTATAPGGTYQWYDAPSGGTLLQTGATYTTPALSANETYYVQTTVNGCAGPRTAVIVVVSAIPVAPTAAGTTICEGFSATLTATAPGGTYQWYDTPSGGTLLQTGATYTTPILAATISYYVQTTVNGCTGPRTTVTVIVNPTPTAPTASGVNICSGNSATLTATAPGGTYQWYDAPAAGTLLQTGASYITPTLTATTTYYVQTTISGCVGPRTAVTVTVTPLPAAPTAAGETICEGFTATLTATAPGGTYEWFDAPSGGTLLQTGATYTTPTLTTNTTYYVQTTVSGCAGPRTAVTVTVTPQDDPSFNYSSGTYCQLGTTTPSITGGFTGTFSASPAGLVFVSTSTGEINLAASTAGTYTVTFTTNGPCPAQSSQVLTITSTGIADFHYDSPFCETDANPFPVFDGGGTAGTFTVTPAGLNFVSASTGQINLVATTPGTYTVTNTVMAAGCYTVTATATVTISPAATVNAGADQTICAGSSVTLAGGFGGSASGITWSGGAGSFSPNNTTTNTVYTPSAGEVTAGTVTLAITTNDPAGSCVAVSDIMVITINPIPVAPSAAGVIICEGTSATLIATAPGGTYQWYDAPAAGTLLQTGASYTTPVLSSNTNYYVQTTVGGCISSRTAVTVTVNPTPAAPTAAGATICEGTSATLTATAPGGTYEWYDAPAAGTLLQTGASYTTPVLSSNTTYYVQTTISGCAGPRTAVTVTINPTPAAPTAAGTVICQGTSATLTATAPGGTYQWYDAVSGGTLLSTGISYVTPVLASNTTYYVQTTIAGCDGPRTAVTVTVNPTPAAPTAAGATICEGFSATLTATAPGGTYQWYDAPVAGTLLQTGASYTTPVLSANTTYYVQTTIFGCVGPRTAVTVTVNPTPAAPTATGATICEGTSATLTATAPGGTYEWYNAASGGTLLQTGATYVTPTLTTTTTYYVQTTISGCDGPRTAVTVTVTPTPAAPTAAGAVICEGTSATLTATAPGGTYEWYNAASGGTLLQTGATYTTPALSANTTYYVQTTISGCVGPRTAVTVTVTPTPAAPAAIGDDICFGLNSTLTATAPGGTYQWYDAPSGGTLLQTGATYVTPTLTTTTTYYVQTTIASCEGPRTAVTVIVYPLPVVTSASSATICSGGTVNIPLTADMPSNFTWISTNNPNTTGESTTLQTTSTINNTIINTTTVVQTVSYTVAPTSVANGCEGNPQTVTVTVNPTPVITSAASNSPVCLGGDISLTSSSAGGTTYNWSGPNGFTSTSQSPVITGSSSSEAGTYFVTSTSAAGCTSTTSTVNVIVNPPPPPPSSGSNSPICTGQNLSLTVATITAASYSWSGPGGYTSTAQNPVRTNATLAYAGTYSIIATVPGCGPSSTGTVAITVNQTPVAPTTGTNSPICEGNNLSLTAIASGSPTYSWSGPNGFTSASQNPVISPAMTADAGTYSVTATENGCTGPAGIVAVIINSIPAAPFAGSNSPVCSGQTLSLTATNTGTTYSWSGPNGFTSTLQNPTISSVTVAASGTYSVTATTSGCTSSEGTVSVTINQTPAPPSASANTPICEGENLSLTASTVGSSTYNWSGPNGFTSISQNTVISPTTTADAGTYSVTATENGCTGSAGTVSVTINPAPAASTAGSNSPVCVGNTISLTASTVGGTTYSWSGPNGFTSTLQNPTIPSSTTADAGTYSVTATSIANGCASVVSTTTVIVNPPPSAPTLGSNSPVCSGQTLSLTSSTVIGATYLWTGPNSFTSTLQNPTIGNVTVAASGTYSMTATVAGCPPLSTVTVSVIINLTPSAPTAGGNTPICVGNDISLTASSTGVTYNWNGPGGYTSTSQNPVITPASTSNSGTYSVTTTSVDNCTSSSGTVTIVVNAPPTTPVAGSNSPVCSGQTLSLTSNTISGASYLWSGPNSFTSTLQNPTISNMTSAEAGTYSVVALVPGCGASPAGIVSVTVNPIPAAPITASNSPICEGEDLSLTASTVGSSTYSWSGPNGFTSSSQNPVITGVTTSDAGTYSVAATENGCAGPAGIVTVTINVAPSAPAAGSNSSVCEGQDISLTATGTGISYSWSGPNGFTSASQNPVISPSTSADAGMYTVTTTSSDGCTSPISTVTVIITPPIFVNAGSDVTVCANNATLSLNGSVSGGTTTGNWTTSGTGTFVPTSSTLNADYIPSAGDTATGTVTLTLTSTNNGGCAAVLNTITITITDDPSANAGANQTLCANNAIATLNGSVNSAATGGGWITLGSGTFSPDTATLNASYTPSSADTTAGSVTLVLITTGNGNCLAESDSITIFFTPAPVVNAGGNMVACNNNANVPLNGTSSTGSGTWSVVIGTGSFTPNANTLNATYNSTPADTVAGSVTLVLSSANNGGCNIVTDTIIITYISKPIVNAGADVTICGNNASVSLSGTSNTGAGTWSAIGGGGTFVPNSLNSTFTPSGAQITAGTATLVLTSSGNGTCIAEKDTMVVTITATPIVNAGFNQTICANNSVVTLSGSFTISTGAGWTTLGSGTFSPDTSTLNATYSPSAADTSAGSVTIVLTSTGNGLCNPVTDTMIITITPSPVVNAGPDIVLCFSNPVANLNGTSSTGSGTWSTVAGTGTFGNTSSLVTTYTATATDTLAGSVTIILTSGGNGTCNAETDTMTITFSNFPSVNAGGDQTVCANNSLVTLNGSSSTGTGYWTTSGDGTFTPNDSILNPDYTPGAIDISSGSAVLYFSSIGGCDSVTDSVSVNITPAPTVNAGINQSVCASATMSVTLNGTTSTGSGQWSTSGSGIFTPDIFTLNAQYTLSTADSAAGSVTLTLTSDNNGTCTGVTDQMTIFVNQPATANAGSDVTVCANNSVQLSGIITGGSGTGIWSTTNGGGSFSPSATNLNATYLAVNSDTLLPTVIVVLSSTNNGACPVSTDTIYVTVTSGPTANAGADTTICTNNPVVQLNGSVINAAGGGWITLGSGTFSPDTSTLNAIYNASSADVSAGSVILVLETTGNGQCNPTTDTIVITFGPAPVVNAGGILLVCEGDTSAQLSGTTSTGNGTWSTLGDGTFIPNVNVLNAVYLLGNNDTLSGTVTLVLTSTSNGNCNAETDTLVINVTTAPVVNAGSDVTVCANNDTIFLIGSVSVGSTTGYWATNGSGIFLPDSSILNGTYIPSAADTSAGTVTLTLTSTNGCRAVSDSLVVTITDAPLVNAGADISICEGLSVSLNGIVITATGGQWTTSGNGTFSPDDLTLNATYIPGSNDTSIVTLVLTSTGNGQCLAVTDTMIITYGSKPIAAFTIPNICTGNPTVFTDASTIQLPDIIASWNWTIDGNNFTVQNPSHTYTAGGIDTITLIVTSGIGCVDTAIQVLNINPSPLAAFTYTVNCAVDSVYFTNTSTIPSGNIISWNWNFGDGNNSTFQNPIHSYSTSGTFTVILTVTSDSGCTATISDTVTSSCNSVLAGFVSSSSVCSGQIILFTDTSLIVANDSISSWNWTFGDGGTDTLQNPSHTYTLSGTYTVTLIVVTNSGATDTTAHVITVNPAPVAAFTALSSCTLDSVYFTDISTISSGTISSWSWNFGDTNTDTVQNPVHYYDSIGVYVVSLIVTSDSGCASTFTDTVVDAKGIIAGFTNNSDCRFNVLFTDTSLLSTGDSVISWNWNFGDGNSDTVKNPSHTYTASGTYTVQLIATTSGGCADTISNTIILLPLPLADFIPAGGIYYQGVSIGFTDLSANASSWIWNFGDGNSDTIQNPSHIYDQNGIMNLVLITMNSNGCPDTVNYSFTIYPNTVGVPSAFTPNNDGVNDELHVLGGPMKEMEWRIYNEWGNEVFYATDQNTGWDGTYKEKQQPATRYVYTLKGTTVSGGAIDMNGEVTIVR